MSLDQNASQNPTLEENSIPTSPQEPTESASENIAYSEPTITPLEALESSPSDFSAKSIDIPPSDFTITEAENKPKPEENQAQNEPISEPQPEADQPTTEVSEPVKAPKPQTAQIPPNEPLETEPEQSKEELAETKTPEPEEKEEPKEKPKISYLKSQKWVELLVLARNAIQFRKRKKLDRVMSLFLQHSKITNDEVEKFLHVSDATATRYLSQLEKEGKIKQNGKTGHTVSYSRI